MTLKDAFLYHQWAINRTLETCQDLSSEEFTRDLGGSFASLRDTLVHTFAADNAWRHRIRKLEYVRPDPSGFGTAEAIGAAWQPVLADWIKLIDEFSLEQSINYHAFDGSPFHNSFEEIARHVVNHGAYHRGQVAMMLRLLGKKAQSTDWIAFSRLKT